jgi:hypothetical protein
MPGYGKGGKAKHFHVHKHYHTGGKVTTKSRSYTKAERAAEMQAENRFSNPRSAGGFGAGTTGGSRPKIKGGGRMCKADGGDVTSAADTWGGRMTDRDLDLLRKSAPSNSDTPSQIQRKSGRLTNKDLDLARKAIPQADPGPLRERYGAIRVKGGGRITRPKFNAGGALYKKGGHSKEMSKHLNAKAPRGHKGLGTMIRRGG